MEAPNPGTWAKLPNDLLVSIFERLNFADFHRAKIVCLNWNSSSKVTLARKSVSPWLMLLPDGGSNCVLYNPEEDRLYPIKKDLSGFQFLAHSGNWFLVLDSQTNLHITDLFSENMIDLPPLESSTISGNFTIERIGNKCFQIRLSDDRDTNVTLLFREYIKGLLWVDDKTEEYVVVWFLDYSNILCFCKKGDNRYTYIPMQGSNIIYDVVLLGYHLYIWTSSDYIRFLDFSGPKVVEDVAPLGMSYASYHHCSIAVTTSGEVSLVEKLFTIDFKGDSDVLYDEALILDSGITVPANHNLGIEPNSIYLTSRYEDGHWPHEWSLVLERDICVFNVATKTFKRFPRLSNMKLKDARWFLPNYTWAT